MLPLLANTMEKKLWFEAWRHGNSHECSRQLWIQKCVFEGVVNNAVALYIIALVRLLFGNLAYCSYGKAPVWTAIIIGNHAFFICHMLIIRAIQRVPQTLSSPNITQWIPNWPFFHRFFTALRSILWTDKLCTRTCCVFPGPGHITRRYGDFHSHEGVP